MHRLVSSASLSGVSASLSSVSASLSSASLSSVSASLSSVSASLSSASLFGVSASLSSVSASLSSASLSSVSASLSSDTASASLSGVCASLSSASLSSVSSSLSFFMSSLVYLDLTKKKHSLSKISKLIWLCGSSPTQSRRMDDNKYRTLPGKLSKAAGHRTAHLNGEQERDRECPPSPRQPSHNKSHKDYGLSKLRG